MTNLHLDTSMMNVSQTEYSYTHARLFSTKFYY